jgi:hypothetical protein
MWSEGPSVGQELSQVVEEDHAVTEQAPALLRVEGDGPGRVTVGTVRRRARGPVLAHGAPPMAVEHLAGAHLYVEAEPPFRISGRRDLLAQETLAIARRLPESDAATRERSRCPPGPVSSPPRLHM